MSWAAVIFVLCVAYVAYVLFGYPALLALLSRWFAKPVRRDSQLRPVSFVIAVRNGEQWIARKLESILALDYSQELREIIVVSDGSTDRTGKIAAGFAASGVRVLTLPPGGKAAALNAGIAAARNEILIFTDVRQALERDSLKRLVANFADPRVGVVSGDLRIRRGDSEAEENLGLYRRYESWIRSRLSAIDSIFGATGSFYGMRRELAVPLPANTLLDDMHLPLAAFFRGYRLIYENSARAYDDPSSLDVEFPRKLRTLAGNLQILRRYPALLGPRNRMWFHFMSYKFGRLLLPYALLAAAVSTAFLTEPFRTPVAILQAAFYGAGCFDVAVPERWALKRVSSLVRTFLVLMAADLCAVVIFFVPASRLWKPTQIRSSPAGGAAAG